MPAQVLTLAISDVPMDDPSSIGSGPTVPDPTTLADALRVLGEYGVEIPDPVRVALQDPANETPKDGDPAFARASFHIVSRPAESLAAAHRLAAEAGYEVIDLGADVEGEAREIGRDHARMAREMLAAGRRAVILSGGELTVTMRGQGRGGPNQEYALALAAELDGMAGIAALAADTDGADGGAGSASDPAGALVGPWTVAEARRQGLDLASFLDDNDSTGFFEKVGGLLVTGPTLTNVNDLRAVLVDSQLAAQQSPA
jgi:glycerate 2-kinase